MKKILIENVQVGISGGGIACGPIDGHVVVEARIRIDDEGPSYYGMVEVDGCSNFYRSSESRYEIEIAEDCEEAYPLSESFSDYDTFYDAVKEMQADDEAHALLLKYIVYLARADWDEIEAMRQISVGKYIGEFEIPVCDAEEDYLEALDEADEGVDPMAIYGTGKSEYYSPVMVALLVGHTGGHYEKPYPCVECALADAERIWNEMPAEDKARHVRFRVARGEFYYSMGGPLFIESELIRDYLN